MARTLDDRLSRLQNRRYDSSLGELAMMSEQYMKRTQNKATRYALGAMQQVDPRSTQISLEEAEKVERNLTEVLSQKGIYPVFRLQGSVPPNIHVRSVSDVDLLVVEGLYLRSQHCPGSRLSYGPYTGRGTLVDDVLFLRKASFDALNQRFWGATVDNTPAKSIQLSEGGFRRKVDVVPANWLDTAQYQLSLNETERGIEIVDQYERTSFANYPFLYRQAIETKDIASNGGAKMAIRLSKNVRNDAEGDIGLSSYDIGGLIYRCPVNYIISQTARDLMILAGVQKWFNELTSDKEFATSMDAPDGTRKIIDSNERWNGLLQLNKEITTLAEEVEREIIGPYERPSLNVNDMRRRLNEGLIPLVPEEIKYGRVYG